ncbi:MAG: threonine synthase [Myxococcota bacterium]
MWYMSTRGRSRLTLSDAIGAGLALDGGLYLPERVPTVEVQGPGERLADTAKVLLKPFFEGDRLEPALEGICERAFTFDAPLRRLGGERYLLELFHGPTAAFKDFAARFLAETLRVRAEQEAFSRGEPPLTATVLVATSGDTGAAVASAFWGLPYFRVVVLYPEGRVSARQAHQLGAFGDNVACLKVRGSFDDCQGLVKAAFADEALRARYGLTSANSISLGRLLPQVVYFGHAALQLRERRVFSPVVVVPTGNLGNAFACLLARRMGLPVGEVILATNANRVLVEYVETGRYEPRPSVATLANAMDVGAPSNWERLRVMEPEREGLRAVSVGDEDIRASIVRSWEEDGVVVCPHTACGMWAERVWRERGGKGGVMVVATAHPAKFETVVEPLLKREVEVPERLMEVLGRASQAEPLEPNLDALRHWLQSSHK